MILIKKAVRISFEKYYISLLLLYFSVIAYTTIVAVILIEAWVNFLSEENPSPGDLRVTIGAIVITATFITNVYEIIYLKEGQADTVKRSEQLNIAKTHAELVALKNHIDPHFIFNSLNTLSYLISKDPLNARLYNDTLAKVYHYILFNRDKDLVPVREEIEFVTNYFYLLKIRFGSAIDMIIDIENLQSEELYIPPISLQILLENAIKHNELKENDPLIIHIIITADCIRVTNRVVVKPYVSSTPGTGLNNLDNRYKLIIQQNILVSKNDEHFTVKLPITNLVK